MDNIKELEEERRKAARLRVGRLVAAMTEPMSKCQPLFLNESTEAIKCPIEWIQH